MTLLPLIQEQTRLRPNAVAVAHGDCLITYRQLCEDAARIAAGLHREGVRPGSLVAVYLSRSPRLLAALLGIWQAGAAYLPLDPTHPVERTAFMAEDSGAAFILSQPDLVASLPGGMARILDVSVLVASSGVEASTIEFLPTADSLAYVIYTSGSTGRPKGAMVTHGSLANTIVGLQRDLQLGPEDVLLALNSVAFDVSGQEYYVPLIAGAQVHIAERELATDGPRLLKELDRLHITMMMGMSAGYRLMLAAGWQGHPNLQLTIGGEAISLELANLVAARSRVLWNHYGPTETSICATREKIVGHTTRVTIGHPLENVRVYVLDEHLSPVPAGSTGEIYIGGNGVGLGYLNRPDLTASCFLPDPFDDRPGARMYKTGDFGAFLEDGRLDFLGRADEQIKLRGFRIELGEIEAALDDYPGVTAAVARTIEFGPDDKRLIAFVQSDHALVRDDLRAAMRRRLPHYMVPAEYIVLAAFPLTPNGKVDRRALDAMRVANDLSSGADLPGNDNETTLLRIWQTLLRTRDVKPADNFFDLGGHSLLAARMVGQIDKQLGVKIPVSVLAQHPTLEGLTGYMKAHAGRTPLVLELQGGDRGAPLFLAHGVGGSLLTFRELVKRLGPGQPVYGLRMPLSLDEIEPAGNGIAIGPALVQRLAAKYVENIRALHPNGPYQLAGHSSAGLVVVEIANQLQEMGCKIHFLGLLDSDIRHGKGREKPWRSWSACRQFLERTWAELKLAPKIGLRDLLKRRMNYHKLQLQFWFVQRFQRFPRFYRTAFATEGCLAVALHDFHPGHYLGDATLFVAEDEPRNPDDPSLGWQSCIGGDLDIVPLPGGHDSIFAQQHVDLLAAHVCARLHQGFELASPACLPSPTMHLAETTIATSEYTGASIE